MKKTICNLQTATLFGLDATLVDVEVDTLQSLPGVSIVGLPDIVIQESKERIKVAIKNSELPFPRTKVTINLAPADIKKEGTHYDLPIALAVVQAALPSHKTVCIKQNDIFFGELGLSGVVRPIAGTLSFALLAKERGCKRIFVPKANGAEANLVSGLEVIGVETLSGLVNFLMGQPNDCKVSNSIGVSKKLLEERVNDTEVDFAHIQGQQQAKRALEIAAAGGHNLLMIGSPGAGKTLLAKAITTILPPLTEQEYLEITRLYSSIGLLHDGETLIMNRPFRQPHHNASVAALVGGGSNVRPGEISLAHRGVLFLDEVGEFNRVALESLRQPLEEGKITVARARGSVTFPARSIVIAAQNPCPCGYYMDPKKECTCTIGQVQKYHQKISGPLLDRIDMHLEIPPVAISELQNNIEWESSKSIQKRVTAARLLQEKRLQKYNKITNAELTHKELSQVGNIAKEASDLLTKASDKLGFSARSYFRIMKIARTIADLEGSVDVKKVHIAEALQYRIKREGFA